MPEVYICKKCGRSHSMKEFEESRFCRNCGAFLFSWTGNWRPFRSRRESPTHAEMIAEVIEELPEPFTTQQIVDAILERFSVVRAINPDSLRTDIAGCCANLRSRYSLPGLPLVLVSVGRGLYRLYDPEKDKDFTARSDILKEVSMVSMRSTERAEKGGLFRDFDKAKKIGTILYDRFRTRSGFFEGYEMPEYVLPNDIREGSVEHACYLTYIISIDYQTDAVRLWQRARNTYTDHPEYFDPKVLMDVELETLSRFLRELGSRYPTNGARAWKRISAVLLEEYNGDPRKITPEPFTVKEAKKLILSFPYLRGKKLSNFYIRAMAEKELFKIRNLKELDIPVDVQVARFTFYTGCLQLKKGFLKGCIHNSPIQPAIEEIWREAARDLGIAPWQLDEPIWTVGSKLCARKYCKPCPVRHLCNRNFDAIIKGNQIHWET